MAGEFDTLLWVKKWNDWAWVQLGVATFIPTFILTGIKLHLLWQGKELVKSRLSTIVDHTFRGMFLFSYLYYFIDSLVMILKGWILEKCYVAFFGHHLFSCLGLIQIYSLSKPIFWFELLMAALHSTVLTFPKLYVIQYIYFCSFLCMIVSVFVKPYNQYPECHKIRRYFIPVLLSFGAMQLFQCLGMMDAVNFERDTAKTELI